MPLGAKGCGEAGTSGGLPSVANAVIDALAEYGIRHLEMPMTPARIWQAIQQAACSAMSQATDVLGSARAPYIRVVGAVSAARISFPTTTSWYLRLCCRSYATNIMSLTPRSAWYWLPSMSSPRHSKLRQVFWSTGSGARALLVARARNRRELHQVIAGMINSFAVMVLMFQSRAFGNPVYHPADYAMLSTTYRQSRSGKRFQCTHLPE